LLTLVGHTNTVTSLAVLPDGKLASGSNDKTVRVWDVVTGACTLLGEHTLEVYTLAVLPDGRLMSADKTVRVWDETTGACLIALHQDFQTFHALALSNGNLAVRCANFGKAVHVYA
jgi:WD40 repeat protein